jgi:hypothetical protein
VTGIPQLITNLDPQPIYEASRDVGQFVFTFITPVLLTIAVAIRVMTTQLDVTESGGKWGHAIRDFLVWGTVLSVYFGLASLIADFMNSVYAMIARVGSLELVTDQVERLLEAFGQRAQAQGGTLLDFVSSPGLLVSALIYGVSLTLVVFIGAVLKIAHAIGYSFAFAYGLVAIPLSLTSHLKLLRGWALLVGGLLLWPVVEGIMLGLFAPVFQNAATALLAGLTPSVLLDQTGMQLLFSVLNLIIAAIMVGSAFVAAALVANHTVIAGLVVPFLTAGVTAAAGSVSMLRRAPATFTRAVTAAGGTAAATLPRLGPRPGGWEPRPSSSRSQTPSVSGPRVAASAAGERPVNPAPRATPMGGTSVEPASPGNASAAPTHDGPAVREAAVPASRATAPGGEGAERIRASRQQRRGVMVDRLKKQRAQPPSPPGPPA